MDPTTKETASDWFALPRDPRTAAGRATLRALADDVVPDAGDVSPKAEVCVNALGAALSHIDELEAERDKLRAQLVQMAGVLKQTALTRPAPLFVPDHDEIAALRAELERAREALRALQTRSE